MHHEFAHSLDEATGITRTAEFRDAYGRDVAALTEEDRARVPPYFLQPGEAGPEETFARLFGEELGTATGLSQYFPHSAAMVRSLMKKAP